jgi:hypothetical protein
VVGKIILLTAARRTNWFPAAFMKLREGRMNMLRLMFSVNTVSMVIDVIEALFNVSLKE